MLLSSGVTIEAAGNRLAVCLANALGQAHIAETIVRQAGPATPSDCPPPADPGAPVLAAYVE